MCGHRALQTLSQPPRRRGHAQIPTGEADTVCAQQKFSKKSPPYLITQNDVLTPLQQLEEEQIDHSSTVDTRVRWRHRGAIQDALGGTLRTFLGAGNESPPLPLPHLAVLGRNPGQEPPNQPPHHRMRIGAAQCKLSRNNGERFLSSGYACVPRADWLRRYHDTVLPNREPTFGTRKTMGYVGLEKSARALPRTRYTWSAFWTTRDRLNFLITRRATRLLREPYEAPEMLASLHGQCVSSGNPT